MKDRILETADRLFYLQGIRAVGVDTIAAEIGISKRTLYNHFPSKDALISAYLERRFVRRGHRRNRRSNKSSVPSIRWSGAPAKDFAAALRQRGRRTRQRRQRGPENRGRLQGKPKTLVPRAARSARRHGCRSTRDAAHASGRRRDRAGSGPRRSAMARAAKEAATALLRNAGVKVIGRRKRKEHPPCRPCRCANCARATDTPWRIGKAMW